MNTMKQKGKNNMGIYIPNMEKPKKGEVIAFDGEYAVYTDDDMQVHRYPLIEVNENKEYYIGQGGWIKEVEVAK